jgi:hypothetical protein
MRIIGGITAVWLLCAAILLGVGALVPDAKATTTVATARAKTAQYERRHLGWSGRGDVRVSADCPVVAAQTRRCYFTVDPLGDGRFGSAPYAGYVRIRDNGNNTVTAWETKVYLRVA